MCRWKWFLQTSIMREIHWLCSSGKVLQFLDCYSSYVSGQKYLSTLSDYEVKEYDDIGQIVEFTLTTHTFQCGGIHL